MEKLTSKAGAQEKLHSVHKAILSLSHRIHSNPELGFEEEKACAWLSEELDGAGFDVKRGICGLPTAFVARAGSGPLHIAICAEYDSLPEIGHACGHNMIAAMAVGAGIAAAQVANDVGLTVSVVGTPAEEVGNASGKVVLLERGAFSEMHAAMMVHPAPMEILEAHLIAASMFDVHYTGKEAHASAFPEMGINAADALTVAQTSIGLLRQHLRQTDRVHGIVTHGGDAPNVVPAHTSARYLVRGENLAELEEVRAKVYRCFEAGAVATGCKLEIRGGDKPYADVRYDHEISMIYKRNAEAIGRKFPEPGPTKSRLAASTDMGNVSYTLPSIHPMIGINSLPAANHQPEFTAHCATEEADKAVLDGALAMVWTAIEMAGNSAIRERLIHNARV
ncbi:MAG TPA: M20 family metallopeptidase [Candidatus Acidoferrales bacterium]|nr:M20 family metallopeptidase [Candidatus Acidoferrales bacterium]